MVGVTRLADYREGAPFGNACRVRVYVTVRSVRGRGRPGGSELSGPGEAGGGEDTAILGSSRGTGIAESAGQWNG